MTATDLWGTQCPLLGRGLARGGALRVHAGMGRREGGGGCTLGPFRIFVLIGSEPLLGVSIVEVHRHVAAVLVEGITNAPSVREALPRVGGACRDTISVEIKDDIRGVHQA